MRQVGRTGGQALGVGIGVCVDQRAGLDRLLGAQHGVGDVAGERFVHGPEVREVLVVGAL